ncbi:MAG TPA: relaxasome subunit MobC [Oribacterium sp.]|nr:relaxasome subunit MobC [Oribacterium sp.]
MAAANFEKQIEDLQKKQAQLKAKEKALRAKASQAERKARTRRLVQVGASVESVLGCPIEEDDLPKLISFLKQQEDQGSYFSKAMGKVLPEQR